MICVKILPSRQNEMNLRKLATKLKIKPAARSSSTVLVGRVGKIRTASIINNIAGFVTMPSEKNK